MCSPKQTDISFVQSVQYIMSGYKRVSSKTFTVNSLEMIRVFSELVSLADEGYRATPSQMSPAVSPREDVKGCRHFRGLHRDKWV